MPEPRDVYNSVKRYENHKVKFFKQIRANKKINRENAEEVIKWLNKKEESLSLKKGLDNAAKIRWSKTMDHYITLLYNVLIWFKQPLKDLTEAEFKQFFKDFESGNIKSKNGKNIAKSTRIDYYNKIFKSHFFAELDLRDMARRVIDVEHNKDGEVRFFTKEDLDSMIKLSNQLNHKLLWTLMYDTGARIGTILNLRKGDFEKRYNKDTKQDYYLIHIRKDYTKSKRDRTVATWLPETTELLKLYFKKKLIPQQKRNNKGDFIVGYDYSETEWQNEDLVFSIGYTTVITQVKRIGLKSRVKTKPDDLPINIHDFRRSSATYWLGRGISIDSIKKRLGHKPSSTVIDKYVNYLGLDEEMETKQIQEGNYKEMIDQAKETREKLIVLDQRLKERDKQMEDMQKATDKKMEHIDKVLQALTNERKIKEATK